MASMADYEQLMLELVNRARLDPEGEAARFGIDLNEDLAPGTISSTAKQPLVFNNLVVDAARDHSQWMLDNDIFSHTGSGGSSAGDRMTAAGYLFTGSWTWGENIASQGTTGTADTVAFVISEHEGLFLSKGHRTNITNDAFRELGIGVRTGDFIDDGTTYDTVMTTQNFAKSGSDYFITGVVYTDGDADDFYSVGEGSAGTQISATPSGGGGTNTSSEPAGGYRLAVANDSYDITFTGGQPSPVTVHAAVAGANIKIDLVDGDKVLSSASTTLGSNAQDLQLLGVADLDGSGNALDNHITGNQGANALAGSLGNDTLDGGAGNDTLRGGLGDDSLTGGDGNDFLEGIDGIDTLDGGNGNDFLLAGADGDLAFGGAGLDTVFGGPGGDSLSGGSDDDLIDANAGNDTLDGDAGNDLLLAGDDNDLLNGGSGNDTLSGANGDDTLFGDDGDDFLIGADGIDHLDGGSGIDKLLGGSGNDILSDDLGTDTLYGATGDDSLSGGADNDTLRGAEDNDTVNGGSGDDLVEGNLGTDSLSGGTGNDTVLGGPGADTLAGDAGADTLNGAEDNDLIDGGADDDQLSGNDGADTLLGGAGDDLLLGGAGNDLLTGGSGNDSLFGAGDADRFVIDAGTASQGNDSILDLARGTDLIEFSGFSAALDAFDDLDTNLNTTLDNGDDHVTIAGSNTLIDLSGQTGGAVTGELTITGVTGLDASDFLIT